MTTNEKNRMEEELLSHLSSNNKWHSWKCRCGCLNNRGNGNCGRCGGMRGTDSMHYGDTVVHGGIWDRSIAIHHPTKGGGA